ncbi:hypothetical protein [Pseudorhizobium flavum]|uniref:hypothetical protein n=1 Tax=Pseudorhizobium flavum TaxID=1335061 RepID=UPI00376F7C49
MASDYPRNLFKAARAALNMNSRQFAALAKVSTSTLSMAENPSIYVKTNTIEKIGLALESMGIEFIPPQHGRGPGFTIAEESLARDAEPAAISGADLTDD